MTIETVMQPDPTCPHCGNKHYDAWEWNFGPALDGDSEGRICDECGGEFDCHREVLVYFTTKPTQRKPT